MDNPIDIETLKLEFLSGRYKHLCPDWDFMAIDERCGEFECCTCDKKNILRRNSQQVAEHSGEESC